MTRVAVLVGPASGSGRGPAATARLVQLLPSARLLEADSRDGALAAARSAVAEGLDVLVAIGGDGTAHLALQAVAGTPTALAVVPTGTGFDAAVNERANRMRWPRGRRRYDVATLLELRTFRPQPGTLTVDGERSDRRVMLVALGNAASYGGGLRICPGADLRDGLLDVVVVGPLARRRLVALFPRLFKGTHVTDPSVEVLRGREVVLEGDGLAVYADGEPFGHLPLTARVVPGALRVVGSSLGE